MKPAVATDGKWARARRDANSWTKARRQIPAQTLTAADEPVPGLYAAGRTAVGICSNSYISGLSLADCVFSGRRAGTHAAGESQ